MEAPDARIDTEHDDLHHVVGGGRPHHRAEGATGVENLAPQEEHAVEENLHQAEGHQEFEGLILTGHLGSAPAGVGIDDRQHGCAHHQNDRQTRHDQEEGRHDAVGVGLAFVRIVPDSPDDLGDEHTVEGAPGQEEIQAVGDRCRNGESCPLPAAHPQPLWNSQTHLPVRQASSRNESDGKRPPDSDMPALPS